MIRFVRYCTVLSLLVFSSIFCQEGKLKTVKIGLKHGSENELEVKTKAKLQQLLKTYDLSKWVFTDTVVIETGVIPHSHPVLTINTRDRDQDMLLLSTFVHEQIHWYVANRDSAREKAINEFREIYPNIPAGRKEGGARNKYSSYLHLIVCYLEYEGMIELAGDKKGEEAIEYWSNHHYTWIYKEVLNNGDKIKPVLRKHGFKI